MAWATGSSYLYRNKRVGWGNKVLPFPFPNLKMPAVDGLLPDAAIIFVLSRCIDTPLAAASSAITTNTMTHMENHISLLKMKRRIRKKIPTYWFLNPGPLAELYKPIKED